MGSGGCLQRIVTRSVKSVPRGSTHAGCRPGRLPHEAVSGVFEVAHLVSRCGERLLLCLVFPDLTLQSAYTRAFFIVPIGLIYISSTTRPLDTSEATDEVNDGRDRFLRNEGAEESRAVDRPAMCGALQNHKTGITLCVLVSSWQT